MFTALGNTWQKRILVVALVGLAGVLAGLTFVARGTTYAGENLVASGYVRDAAGTAVAGARVALYDARPTDDATISAVPLVTTTSASDGSYALPFSPTAALAAEAAANGGYNNFYIAATAGASRYFLGITRGYSSGIWTSGGDVAADDLTPGTSASGTGPNLYCGFEIRKKRIAQEQALTVIGETHVVADMREDFTYGTTADSDIDIAASFDGGSSWSIRGSFHVGNVEGAAIKWYVYPEDGHEWRSNFVYRKYKHWDLCGDVWYSVEPRQWTGGGAWPGADGAYLDHHCASWYASTAQDYGPGSEFTRSSRKLYKFGVAVNVFGVNLGARSGASRYVIAHWKFGTGQLHHWLCGSNNQPSSARRILAGA
jgi:hypothetical protein